ncbi:hypothetical protein PMAYCL1PPCAC_30034, partial [Pristionchus mayeri]
MVRNSQRVASVAEQLRTSSISNNPSGSSRSSGSGGSGGSGSSHPRDPRDAPSHPRPSLTAAPLSREVGPSIGGGATTISIHSPTGSPPSSVNRPSASFHIPAEPAAHHVSSGHHHVTGGASPAMHHHSTAAAKAKPVLVGHEPIRSSSERMNGGRSGGGGGRANGSANGGAVGGMGLPRTASDRRSGGGSGHGNMENGGEGRAARRRNALEFSLLPALEKLSRTRHAGAELEQLAEALKAAEEACPGLCDQLVAELLTTLAHPQVPTAELSAAIARLTTSVPFPFL